MKITLNGIRTLLPRQTESWKRIFRRIPGGTSVRDDQWCISV